jgi:hypothetical protein
VTFTLPLKIDSPEKSAAISPVIVVLFSTATGSTSDSKRPLSCPPELNLIQKAKPGQVFTATVMQDVPLPDSNPLWQQGHWSW